ELVDDPAVGLRPLRIGGSDEFLEQLAKAAAVEEAAEILLHRLEKMRRHHLDRRDDGQAGEGSLLLAVGRDPARRRPVDRFGNLAATGGRRAAVGEKDEDAVTLDGAAGDLDPLDP